MVSHNIWNAYRYIVVFQYLTICIEYMMRTSAHFMPFENLLLEIEFDC